MMEHMKPLSYPARHRLNAALGWLELGDPGEAAAELDPLPPWLRQHPDVLELRWRIAATTRNWEVGLELAAALIRVAPDRPAGWSQRSHALHELQRTQEARDRLLPVVDRFPNDPFMHYNLACYECRLGRLPEAKQWLTRALRTGDGARIQRAALGDPELQPLWPQVAALCQPAPRSAS